MTTCRPGGERPGSWDTSPFQKRGISRSWYHPGTKDFIEVLRFRGQAGEVYAINGQHERADILVRSLEPGTDRWVRAYTYPWPGLRAMAESKIILLEEVLSIPDFDPEELQRSAADQQRFGPCPEFWRVTVPAMGEVRDINKRPYRGRR